MRCCDKPDIREGCANYVCLRCGQTDGQIFCAFESYEVNRNDYRKKKSVHSRTRGFRDMLMDYVSDDRDREILYADFPQLVRCYEWYSLLKGRNMSVYGYYIRKLSKRRCIPLTDIPRDVKTPKVFNRRYNKARRILGWKFKEQLVDLREHRIPLPLE